ncbi:MAG: cysteine--tRNA ligase [Symploca sp. SIO2E9]|nr:cysteine--tRNA ligase [Symploca sp. SIO2E9]
MTLTLYNTLTASKEAFEPVETGKVRMYCCGITVYDYCHLGHARTCIIWDTARQYMQWRGYDVRYLQNFTDIDDKILNRAKKEGTSMEDVSERFIKAYFEDMERLNIKPADDYPRATHNVDGIKRLVSELEEKGYAYPAEGDVYYAVRQFPEYGKLSGCKLKDLRVGASGRVEVNTEESKKKDPFDFALWKASKPGEPFWESPWGVGRPGWHIECSAMIREQLGETIDIHAGGSDLIFPHHENEIAQSEAANGKPLARYWMHTGMVKVGGEKMSKSLGNFITIRELLDRPVEPMAVRLFVLQAQYRKPLDFTDDAIEAATNGWNTLQEGLRFGHQYGKQLGWKESVDTSELGSSKIRDVFAEAVDDDFNFAGGLAVLFEIAKDLRRQGNLLVHEGKTDKSSPELEQQWHTLVELAQVFGLEAQPQEAVKEEVNGLSDTEIESLIEQRQQARKGKNYPESDRIRDQLQSQGITLIDQAGGVTRWHRD